MGLRRREGQISSGWEGCGGAGGESWEIYGLNLRSFFSRPLPFAFYLNFLPAYIHSRGWKSESVGNG